MKNLFILFIVLLSLDVSAQCNGANAKLHSGTNVYIDSAFVGVPCVIDGDTVTRRILVGQPTFEKSAEYNTQEKERINSEIVKLQSEIEILKKIINILINK